MKKIFSFFIALLIFSACSKKESSSISEAENHVSNAISTEKPDIKTDGNTSLPGYALINSSDCTSCHKNQGMFIGPSYDSIAMRYSEKDVELLASNIVDGGMGNWGEVPMQPHPNLSKEDAKKMVEYILSMKK